MIDETNKQTKASARKADVYVDNELARLFTIIEQQQEQIVELQRNVEDLLKLVVRNFPRQNFENNQVVEKRIMYRHLDTRTFTIRTKFSYSLE